MLISEIYDEYKIMPSLQAHMYRVAAVAELISNHLSIPAEKEAITSACLLHDMGNILKFNFDLFPDFLEPEGRAYWEHVQEEYRTRFGSDEHEATHAIALELHVPDRVIALISSIGFTKAQEVARKDDFSKKICCYSDHRVGPMGVLSLEERIAQGKIRFAANKGSDSTTDVSEDVKAFTLLEEQIFSQCSITPDYITDETIHELYVQAEHFDVPGTVHPKIAVTQ